MRFFDHPSMSVLLGWMFFQVAAPFLVFLFRRYLAPARVAGGRDTDSAAVDSHAWRGASIAGT